MCHIHQLTDPICNAGDPLFVDFIDGVGEDTSQLQVDLHPWITHSTDMEVVRNHIFPDHILPHPDECVKRAFLTPLNVDVSNFNAEILQRLPGDLCESSFRILCCIQ